MVERRVAQIREVAARGSPSKPLLTAACGSAPGKGRDFMAIAAKRHRAPAPASGPRVIVEKEPTGWVGTNANAGACSFRNELRSRAGDGGQEPVQTPFAGDELQPPFAALLEKFVVTFGDA